MSVIGAIAAAVGQTALTAGEGALGYGINELFGVRKHAQRQQLKQQNKLNALSYEWNKRNMNYAQELEKQMYAYTFDMNKPESLKNLYKEAGLNPALMYGTSAGGITGTSIGGGKSGAYNSQAANEAQIIESSMALSEMGLQLSKLRSEIDVNKSIANKNNADAGLSNAKTKTEEQVRDAFVANLFYEGKLKWLDVIKETRVLSSWSGNGDTDWEVKIIGDKFQLYGGISVPYDVKDSLFGRQILSAIQASEALKDNHIANTALTNERTFWYFKEMMADIAMKDAAAAEAKAKELQSLWQIGEHVNWKTILESGVNALNTTLNVISSAYGGGLIKGLKGAGK